MNDTISLEGIFNTTDKEAFLNQYENINTKRAFIRIFRNTYKVENKLQKDLYLFNKEELEKFYEQTTPSTEISARNFGRMINQYLKWSVENDLIKEHPFPVQQHYFLRYVKKEADEFLSEQELRYYTHFYFKNLQDGVLLELLFFGVQGKEGSEICNLTIDDIDRDNNCMEVFDDKTGEKRVVHFKYDKNNSVVKYCLSANKEDRYEKRNNEMEENPRIRPYTDLIMDTKYVLKNSKTNLAHEDKATKYTIYNRLKNIQKFKEIAPIKHKITIKNIVKSGQLYMASKLYEKDGVIDLPQLREICKQFGVKEHWSMRDYLNEENILKVYPHLKVKI